MMPKFKIFILLLLFFQACTNNAPTKRGIYPETKLLDYVEYGGSTLEIEPVLYEGSTKPDFLMVKAGDIPTSTFHNLHSSLDSIGVKVGDLQSKYPRRFYVYEISAEQLTKQIFRLD